VALEYARGHLLTGFPWCLIGYTQYEQGSLLQLSCVTGVYGISFLIVLVNAVAFEILSLPRFTISRAQKAEFVFAASLFLGALLYGHALLRGDRDPSSTDTIRVAVVQGNIDQSIKWDPRFQEQTLEIYRSLTLSLRAFRPELLVWPETATPFFYQDNRAYAPRVEDLARQMGTALIFGSPAYREEGGKISYFNRAYVLHPPEPLTFYDKVRLVPFGEFVPLKKWLPFVRQLVPAAGDFEAGQEVRPLLAGGVSTGVLICFEAIFPEIARQHVLKGASALVNLTNDAWFGQTSAPYQHLAMAVFRAAENGRPLIRAANTGISAFMDDRGRIVARSPLFERCTLQGSLAVPARRETPYTRWGDWLPWGLIVLSSVRLTHALIRRRAC
jgi:apolipoprotein N-acyltransferase